MPYNPQIEYRGDRALFAGIADAGKSVAEGVRQWRANREESQFLDQQAEMIGQLIAPKVAQGGVGFDPKIVDDLANFPGLSLSQKRGKLSGLRFMYDQNQRAEQAAVEDARHKDAMEMRRVMAELQRGQLLAGDVRDQRRAQREDRSNADTMAVMMALTGQTQLPSPVDPEKPGAFLQQEYPNADDDVMKDLLKDFSPAGKARLAIDQGNLDVAKAQVENRREQVANEATRVNRKTLTPSALASFTKAKAHLRMAQQAATEADKAAIQRDIDQLDALMAESMPEPKAGTEKEAPPAMDAAQVRAAVKAGKLTREQGVAELKRLGYQ